MRKPTQEGRGPGEAHNLRRAEFDSPSCNQPTDDLEHITDGTPCWCDPEIIREKHADIIVHRRTQ